MPLSGLLAEALCLAFAHELAWRGIEATLGANPTKLYAIGLRQAVLCSTLVDANERRDWGIWADLAGVLIRRASALYASHCPAIQKPLALKSSLYTCLQILSVSVFEKTLISCALQCSDYTTDAPPAVKQSKICFNG